MIGERRKTLLALAGIALLAGAPVAWGQCLGGQTCCPGSVVSQTLGCPYPCSTITVSQCEGGNTSGTGECYPVQSYICCGTNYTSLGNQAGSCNIGQTPLIAPMIAEAAGGGVPRQVVWVRGCTGRYALLELPVTG